jgi:acetyl esterase/lipase
VRGLRAVCGVRAALVMVLVMTLVMTEVGAAGPSAGARASVRGNGATRDGDPPIVPLVISATTRVSAPRPLHQATFAYGRDAAQRLDAYWTAGSGGRQAGILLLHGGYWLEGDKSTWRPVARRLVARGYAVFAANYRLSPQAPWPAQLTDATAALGYIQRHAGRFHLDPSRMVVIGSSAGGQLATMMGVAGTGHIRGAVALSPVNAPYLAYVDGGRVGASAPRRKLRRAVAMLVRCVPAGIAAAACMNRIAAATPQVTASAVPMLFLHSRGDFVPAVQSAVVRDALAATGVTVDLKIVPGVRHGAGLLRAHHVAAMVEDWIDAVTS